MAPSELVYWPFLGKGARDIERHFLNRDFSIIAKKGVGGREKKSGFAASANIGCIIYGVGVWCQRCWS